jgi:hypothetical protein
MFYYVMNNVIIKNKNRTAYSCLEHNCFVSMTTSYFTNSRANSCMSRICLFIHKKKIKARGRGKTAPPRNHSVTMDRTAREGILCDLQTSEADKGEGLISWPYHTSPYALNKRCSFFVGPHFLNTTK